MEFKTIKEYRGKLKEGLTAEEAVKNLAKDIGSQFHVLSLKEETNTIYGEIEMLTEERRYDISLHITYSSAKALIRYKNVPKEYASRDVSKLEEKLSKILE